MHRPQTGNYRRKLTASSGASGFAISGRRLPLSGTKPKSAQYDARGIFLTYTCEDCHARKMAGYRPDVLTDPAYWTDEPIEDD
jgi:hypothetical protein